MARAKAQPNLELRWTPFTAGEDFALFYEYNKQDVRAELEASSRIPDLSSYEFPIWQFDLRCNMRGMQIATQDVENCIAVMEQCYAKYNGELKYITGGAVGEYTEVQATLNWLAAKHGIHLYNLDEDTVSEALKANYPAEALRVIRIRQMLGFGSVKKLYAFRAHTCNDGRLRDQYVYHGTHTGLWNGRAVQPANLYKGIFSKPWDVEAALQVISYRSMELVEQVYGESTKWKADALEVVASCLRSMIIAAPGHRLMSADFSSIQAVVTAALAGEEWRLEVFRTHGQMYYMQAAMLTGKTLQWYLDYKKEHKKHHEDRQNFGKIPVLSGDFGAWINGWKKFGADKLGDDDYIKKLILQLRDSIPNTVEFWGGQTRNKFKWNERAELYGLEGAAISAVLQPGTCFRYRQVAYQMFEDSLYCMGPSGTFMQYHAPRLERARKDYSRPWELEMTYEGWNTNATKGKPGWMRMALYGGVQTQNIVSHEARNVQAEALLRLERHGYPVVMHTHDENVAEVPNDRGSLEEYMALMRELPTWAVDMKGQPWPIKVPDAWEQQRYGKWEFD